MNQYRPYNVYRPRSVSKVQSKKGKIKSAPSLRKASLIGVIVFLVILGIKIDTSQRAAAREAAEITRRQQAISAFQKEIDTLISSAGPIDFSVHITDSKYGLSAKSNSNQALDAASTAKLITAAFYLQRVDKGVNSLTQEVDGRSAKVQLREMIQRSNDRQWQYFNDLLGRASLQRYAHSLGLSSYSSEKNVISAADMTRFLKRLYEGELLSKSSTVLLLSYMKNTNYEDFISPAVGSQYTFHHKVGANEDHLNDVAIIGSPTDNLYVSIFTDGNGTYNWSKRAELFQQITKIALRAYLE